MVVKLPGNRHFTKDLGGGTLSHRLILAGEDECDVKMTQFHGARNFRSDEISYGVDETVYVVSGLLMVATYDGQRFDIGGGGCYHVPAGESYSLEVLEDCVAVCVFSSPAVESPVPDDF